MSRINICVALFPSMIINLKVVNLMGEEYLRFTLFDIINDIVTITIANVLITNVLTNYYVVEYTKYVEIGIILWVFLRFIYYRRYDLRLSNENIIFFNMNEKIDWESVTKITITDGWFFIHMLFNLHFMGVTPLIQIDIEYNRSGVKKSVKFLFTQYTKWRKMINNIMSIVERKGIVCEKKFKFSGTERFIWPIDEDKRKKTTRLQIVLFVVGLILICIKLIRSFR